MATSPEAKEWYYRNLGLEYFCQRQLPLLGKYSIFSYQSEPEPAIEEFPGAMLGYRTELDALEAWLIEGVRQRSRAVFQELVDKIMADQMRGGKPAPRPPKPRGRPPKQRRPQP